MRITLNGLDYAIRFTRDGDKKTYCDIKVGDVGQNPKEMAFHVVGSAQRMSIDKFDKVEGYKLALERAMKALNLKRWEQRADSLALHKDDRTKIWAAFRKWVEDNHIKTHLHLSLPDPKARKRPDTTGFFTEPVIEVCKDFVPA